MPASEDNAGIYDISIPIGKARVQWQNSQDLGASLPEHIHAALGHRRHIMPWHMSTMISVVHVVDAAERVVLAKWWSR